MTSKNTLLLVDGSHLMHRAYHAMPDLTDRQGRPTGAVYGFIRMLLRAMKDLQPTHVAVALDRKEPTFRKSLYIGYQSNRQTMDEELASQFKRIREILQALEIPVYDKAGFEADDVMGTISSMLSVNSSQEHSPHKNEDTHFSQGHAQPKSKTRKQSSSFDSIPSDDKTETIILTGDKDLMQLVNKHVQLAFPIKGTSEITLYDQQKVNTKLGIPPNLVVDYKALIGDPSDNYPGVPGIGPKTAIKLLNKFGNFKRIYQALDEITHDSAKRDDPVVDAQETTDSTEETKESRATVTSSITPPDDKEINDKVLTPNIIKKLQSGREAGELSQQLATIKTDVPIDFELDKCRAIVSQPGKLARVLEDYGFKTLSQQMGLDKIVGGEVKQLKLV